MKTMLSRGATLVACALVSASFGCNDNRLGSTPPDIAAAPDELVFYASLMNGNSATLTLVVSNEGGGALDIQGIELDASTSPEFSWAFGSPSLELPLALASSDYVVVQVTFTPTDGLPETGNLLIHSNDPDEDPLVIPITSSAIGASVSCSPNPVTFLTAPQQTVNRTVTCTNDGNDDLEISAFVTDPTTSADFSPAYPPTPATLAPAEQLSFQVAYTPGELGPDSGQILVQSDSVNGDYTIDLAGEGTDQPLCTIQALPFIVDFGTQTIGQTTTKQVILNNNGEADCEVTSVTVNGLGNQFSYNGPQTFTIAAGGAQLVSASYTPDNRVPDFAVLTFQSNDPNGETGVPMFGNGNGAEIDVFPCPADFGLVTLGCKLDKDFTIYNSGDANLSISSATINGGGGQFSVITQPPSTITPGNSGTMQVRFQPANVGAQSATLVITNNDPDESTFMCELMGEGTNNDHQVDTFNTDVPQADLLFVVDNSGSMSDEQQLLADSFSNFFNYLVGENVSFHVGVTTTDIDQNPITPGEQGKLVGNPKIIDNNTPNAAQEFADNAKVGTNGDATERGLEGGRLAITEPLASTDNAGFLRPQAKLFMIFVSDEEDQSPLPDQLQPPDYYWQSYLNVKGNHPELVSASAVVGQPGDTCAQEGARYKEVVAALGGVDTTICTNDFSPALQSLGFEITAPVQTFFLTRVPIPATIQVYVDNVLQGAGTWTYDPMPSNSVTLNTAPAVGSVVKVEYDVVCDMP